MITFAAAPLLVGLLLAAFHDQLARRLRPNVAVPLLTALSLTVALCTGLILSAVAVLVCVRLGPLPQIGQWSASALQSRSGVPLGFGVAATAIVAGCLTAAVIQAVRSARALAIAARAARLLRPVAGDLVVIEDATPSAYAVAAFTGRIVVSTAMLKALSADERRALLAHEHSHLRHRHHLYLHGAHLAAAANPLLRSPARSISRLIERWADEDAAAEVGDRALTARALARAALARDGSPPAPHTLSAADHRVGERARLLLAPQPVHNRLAVVLAVGAGLLTWAAAGAITLWANGVVQFAEAVYTRR
ncbi:M48 family metalloprotease [Actinopolymorpha pittospori]|uniref:Zn-dependent protease with chaperone function n=1 Tax=Actinopolymorpha pittospori TaxID=648752 RepID=A0A927MW88_9ACTN|nr:M48 family metalloprotease [Actinopolymorpha pittospori]MBE1608075.1 Zn-dependent protease with chaperone function [Actinopolymorpha pittospori]